VGELVRAGLSGYLSELHTDAFNMSGWIIESRAQGDTLVTPLTTSASNEEGQDDVVIVPDGLAASDTFFSDVTVVAESVNDVDLDGEDQTTIKHAMYINDHASSFQNKTVDDNADHSSRAVTGEHMHEILIGHVHVLFEFLVTVDSPRQEVEETALRMSHEDWRVVCGNTHARIVPRLIPRHLSQHVSEVQKASKNVFVATEIPEKYRTFWNAQTENQAAIPVLPLLLCPALTFLKDEFSIEPRSSDSVSMRNHSSPQKDTSLLNNFLSENSEYVSLTIWNVTADVRRTELDISKDGSTMRICCSSLEKRFSKLLNVKLVGAMTPDSVLTEEGSGSVDDSRKEGAASVYNLSTWLMVERCMSVVCVSVSAACLVLTVLIYSFFPSLNTVASQNTVALCVNLLAAQTLQQWGSRVAALSGAGCGAVGMLTHYFWLSAVLWTNTCSYHMHHVFTTRRGKLAPDRHFRCNRRVVVYTLYSQGISLMVVGATIAGSILTSQGRQIGYGGETCFLASPFLVGVAFALPLTLVLACNLTFFLRAVRRMATAYSPSRHRRLHASVVNALYTSTLPNNNQISRPRRAFRDSQCADSSNSRSDTNIQGGNNSENFNDTNIASGPLGTSLIIDSIAATRAEQAPIPETTPTTSSNCATSRHTNALTSTDTYSRAQRLTDGDHHDTSTRIGVNSIAPEHFTALPASSSRAYFPSSWRRHLNVCLRLSSLMGLYWTLLLLADLSQLRLLRLLSVVVNGSQGVLIAASFLLTCRVRRLYTQVCDVCERLLAAKCGCVRLCDMNVNPI
jgi:hypothetical protein